MERHHSDIFSSVAMLCPSDQPILLVFIVLKRGKDRGQRVPS